MKVKMKKRFIILITLFTLLLNVNKVSAMTLEPTGVSSGKREEEITLYITLNRTANEKTISAVDGVLSFDSNVLELVSSSNLMTNWTELAEVSNNKSFGYGNLAFNNLITNTSQNIVQMTFKIKSDADYGNTEITISDSNATDEMGDSVEITGGTHTIKVLSDVNTLSNITISNGTINFNSKAK